MTRQHARSLAAMAKPAADSAHILLVAPCPGLFRSHVRLGDVVTAGQHLGDLEVLGQLITITAAASGLVTAVAAPALSRAPVDHGALLVALDPTSGTQNKLEANAPVGASASGLVFRAPTSGRFYRRASPDKAPFVEVGTVLAPGATVCLLEVMKTFHRVTYGGAELPPTAKVSRLLVADGDDVTAGDALLALAAT